MPLALRTCTGGYHLIAGLVLLRIGGLYCTSFVPLRKIKEENERKPGALLFRIRPPSQVELSRCRSLFKVLIFLHAPHSSRHAIDHTLPLLCVLSHTLTAHQLCGISSRDFRSHCKKVDSILVDSIHVVSDSCSKFQMSTHNCEFAEPLETWGVKSMSCLLYLHLT